MHIVAITVAAVAFLASETSCLVKRSVNPDEYLSQFGYLPTLPPGSGQHSDAARKKAIRDFQHMARLPETGRLDRETIDKMAAPRCGMPDRNDTGPNPNAPQAFKTFNKWKKTKLTWKILNFSPDMPAADQRLAFTRAFNYWHQVTNLDFVEVSKDADADFKLSFGPGDHGCGYPFDGPGGVLAHCFYPESGQAHFDEHETWSEGTHDGTNLRIVATHELGHGLGLAHSDDPTALMAPWYQGYTSFEEYVLPRDDIMGIQSLYGENGKPIPTLPTKPTIPPTQPPTTGACHGAYDAIINTPDGMTYAFRGYNVFRMSARGLEAEADIRTMFFPEPRKVINAATYSPRMKKVYLFIGTQIFRYEYKASEQKFYIDEGYPTDYQSRSDYPRNPDAALVDAGGWTNIFEGSKVWFFDEMNRGSRKNMLSDIISYFPKAPSGKIDAAAFIDNTYYLFQGQYYYTATNRQPVVGPMKKDQRWMGC
ncbi:neutrophil collagenase-like [Tubulanus polymorphus]|uniref:neutrophil collagenase-like n=1 Tax=Tubulanus polymorphus TaxID=672921 RepID=UPI003DA3977F